MKKAWNKRLTDELELSIIEDYQSGLSSIKVAVKYGFRRAKTVLDVLAKHSIKRRGTARVTNYDRSFFADIHTEAEAYAMGLFITDGYVMPNKGIGIQLQARDANVLYKLGEVIGSSCSFMDIEPRSERHQAMVRMTVHCQQILRQAELYGLIRNKTHVLEIQRPIVNKVLRHFCRGVFDGDGSLGLAKNGNIWCQFTTASKKFADQFSALALPAKVTVAKPSKGRCVYTVRVCGGNAETLKFLRWLYCDAAFYIERKHQFAISQVENEQV